MPPSITPLTAVCRKDQGGILGGPKFMISDKELKKMEDTAREVRKDLIKMLVEAGSGHSAGTLSIADIFVALYFGVLNINPKKPWMEERDRLFLSNGHICPAQYAVLARRGYFPVKELMTLRKLGTRLQGHPHFRALPGIENTSGPLAQGQSIAVGSAIAAKVYGKKYQVYCVLGDGEQDEGQTWEAVMLAGKHKLDNLTFIMDRNCIQIDGYTEDVMPLEPLADKYRAFNWHVIDVDGHNIAQIIDACNEAKSIYEKPVMILAHTIPGKGVSFMEGKFEWHGKVPNKEEAALALKELSKA